MRPVRAARLSLPLAVAACALLAPGCGGGAGGRGGDAGADIADAPAEERCAPADTSDRCRAERAEARFATDPDGALAEALAIEDAALRDLVILAGVRVTGRDHCEHLAGRGLYGDCSQTVNRPHLFDTHVAPDAERERGRDERAFRAAEIAAEDDLVGAFALCADAGAFVDPCFTHLIAHAARWRAASLDGTTFRAAIVALESTATELTALVDRPRLPDDAVRRQFWDAALHELLVHAAMRGQLDAWTGLGVTFDAGDPRRAQFDDLHRLLWIQLQLQGPLRAEARAGRVDLAWLSALRAEHARATPLDARAPDTVAVVSAPAAMPGARPIAPDVLSADDLDRDGPVLYRFDLGAAPWPLDPQVGCDLDADVRGRVVTLWALRPFPWRTALPVLVAGLDDVHPAVRGYAVEAVYQKLIVSQQAGAEQDGSLLATLDAVAAGDPDPTLRRRAAGLRAYVDGSGPRPRQQLWPASSCAAGGPR